MARTWIIPAGAGVLSGLLFLSVTLLSDAIDPASAMILGCLAPLPLFATGLGTGLIGAALAGTTATVLVGLSVGPIPALTFAALLGVPAILLIRQALLSRIDATGRLEWYPPGRLVAWLTGIGAVLFLAATLFLAGGRSVEERIRGSLTAQFTAYLGGAPPPELQGVIDLVAACPSIVVVSSWMAMMAFNGILAQGLLARFGRNLRPSPAVGAIELPRAVGPVTALAVLLAALAGGWLEFAGRNLLVMLGLAFCCAGVGVVHGLLRHTGQPQLALAGFYLFTVLFLWSGWPVLLLALIGLVDHWAHLRQRFGGPA